MRTVFLAASVTFAICSSTLVSVEHPLDVPDAWTVTGPSDPEALVELTFAVKQQHLNELHDVLMRVSDPRSPSYGEHLSNEEVHKLIAPRPEHLAAVRDFLRRHGVEGKHATPNGDMIVATVPFAIADEMMSARYMNIVHTVTGNMVDRPIGGYLLPQEVAAAIDFVAPAAHIPGVRQSIQVNTGNRSDWKNEPKTLRQLYSVDAEGKAAANKQAVTAFNGEFISETALKDFWDQYCPGIQCGKGFPKLVGDATAGSPTTEAMLDIEYITGVGGGIATEFWGFAGNSPDNPQNEPFMKWLAQISNTSDFDVPKLFSSSYGEGESTWSYAAAQRLNAEFMKAGARGITLLSASGDTGANCEGYKFTANMPPSSPYVTGVGGTKPAAGFPEPTSESAIGLSSGGFSNYWGMPDWQKDAVTAYLKSSGVPSYKYNTSGRAFPDIAAQAAGFCVTPFGCGAGGTSASSPTAAGIIGLLNDLRLQRGKATLGFLNPLLYQNADAFSDITTGASTGCFMDTGWPAKKGWDAVTGLGTPNYQKLAKVVAELPGPAPVWERQSTLVV
eukprot:TRINITY_DN7562_c0_g1_i1.p1 TRINITY_DN7562_c0_g1~~TRINITY_DN7562_c0_g1_i1.p1  ORF type:complete len:559 (-),score=78.46 TRINITY_DN7562_c0_g1_i1:22-1698(-)